MADIKMVNERYLTQLFETEGEYTEWFGYYNYDVLSADGKKMLCNRASFDNRAIEKDDTLDLGWYDLTDGTWHKIATTDSFNWPQGAQCQWIPGSNNTVVYNASREQHYISVIHNIDDGSEHELCFPVYCVTPDGKMSISLNYERSYWCRAYHYQSVANHEYNVRVAEDDGVFALDLEKNTVKRIISIQDVIAQDYQPNFDKAKHWLEHIMINRNGTEITFLHRFSFENGYETRVVMANIDGTNLQVVTGWKLNEWSHFGWKDNESFVIYAIEKSAMQVAYAKKVQQIKKGSISPMVLIKEAVRHLIPNSIKNKLRGGGQTYQEFIKSGTNYVFSKDYDKQLFVYNGHPSFTADGRYMITDTYPDTEGYQNLIFYDARTDKGMLAGRLYAALKGTPASCDLHPKLCFHDQYLVVDTAYTGRHRMILYQINWDNILADMK